MLRRWPLVRQILEGGDGTGRESFSPPTRSLAARTDASETFRSVCPYCGVGCGQLVKVKSGKVVAIEGDPESPISQGCLCPKGAASYELITHSQREMKVKYRAPYASDWMDMDLEDAMDRVAFRIWESRRATWEDVDADGSPLRRTTAIAHLGGATLDVEENYLIKKLFTGGLGMVCLSNQARI